MKLLLKTENSVRVIADSAIGRTGQPWFRPECGDNWRWQQAVAYRIGKLGKNVSAKFADRYFDAVTLLWVPQADDCDCLDFMDSAVVCGKWLPIESINAEARRLLAEVSRLSTMKTGDIIAIVNSSAPQPIEINQHISQYIDNTEVLSFNIK